MKTCVSIGLLAALLVSAGSSVRADGPGAPGPTLSHVVFFELKENTDAAREKLAAACQKYLSGHRGTVYFSVGALAEDLKRDVNDRDFHVALHVVFKNKTAHDAYMTNERHLKFIEECQEGWKKVRVFDSYLWGAKDEEKPRVKGEARDEERTEKTFLPDPASGFAGMIKAKILAKKDAGLVVLVEGVTEEWKQSKAPNAKSLVGKKVLVEVPMEEGKPVKAVARLFKILEVGAVVPLDVAHKKGEALTVLELTEDQRERVKKFEEDRG
jgi:hypothetical protein